MRHLRATLMALVQFTFILALAACHDEEITGTSPDGRREPSLSWGSSHRTFDDELARIARTEIPGFAGYYIDDNGNDVVMLVDANQREKALMFVAQRRRNSQLPAAKATLVRSARWDFGVLKNWHDVLVSRIPRRGLVLSDIDEVHNRLLIGVEDARFIGGVKSVAVGLGIPADALMIEKRARPEGRGTIREERVKKAGGLEIQAPSWKQCTLGVNSGDASDLFFLTASHCTEVQFGLDPDLRSAMYQPNHGTSGFDNWIGREELDPPLKVDQYGNTYRYSEAALFRYKATIAPSNVEAGAIMRTLFSASGGPGSIDVDEGNPFFWVTHKNTSNELPRGALIQKVGRTTGWTRGSVTNTCVTLYADDQQTKELRCHWIANTYSDPGDSGAAMFYASGQPDWSVSLQGVLFGGPPGDPHTTWYSPISGIEADMGSLPLVYEPTGPAPPPTLSASIVNGHPHLSWNHVTRAYGYRMYRHTPSLGWHRWGIDLLWMETSWTDTSAPETVFYGYYDVNDLPTFDHAAYAVRSLTCQPFQTTASCPDTSGAQQFESESSRIAVFVR